MKSSEVQKAVSGLNRTGGQSCLFVAALLLAGAGVATVATVQGGEKDDVEALRQSESEMAQAWVQRIPRPLQGIRNLYRDQWQRL